MQSRPFKSYYRSISALSLACTAMLASVGCSSSNDDPGANQGGAANAGAFAGNGSAGQASGSSGSGGSSSGNTGASGGTGAGGASSAGTSSGGAGGSSTGGAAGSGNGGVAGGVDDVPLGPVAYQQTFEALSPGLWKKNLDGGKIKAHPENATVSASCGVDDSQCFRVIYRQADGIHKQPASSPVFTGSGASIDWTPSDTGHTNTATDVTQANISIDGSSDGKSSASAKAVPSKAYTLSYEMYFEPGFDFAKGGKLPGLAAAEFDSGCTEDGNTKRQTGNWSERLMWRANGRLQLYSYDQSRVSGSCGVEMTIDQVAGDPEFELPGTIPNDDKFRLKAGVWYSVQLSVRVNDNDSVTYKLGADGKPELDADGFKQPTGGNGAVALWIKSADGDSRQLVFNNVALRDECDGPCPEAVPDSKAAWVNGLFFSTFYGGNETKRTTCIDAAKSTLQVVVANEMPSYPGLTQPIFDQLCASQQNAAIYPKLTWNPQTPSAVRFDNFVINQGYTTAPIP